MHIDLSEALATSPDGVRGKDLLKACVHCGFCNATCPTYQQLGDEQDGPRGRIYRVADILQGRAPDALDILHFDRCLTCLNCETTCPSGVRYGEIIDIARELAGKQRSLSQQWLRKQLVNVLLHPWTARIFSWLQPLLQRNALKKLGTREKYRNILTTVTPPVQGRVMLFEGCIQPYLMPEINEASQYLLHTLGFEVLRQDSRLCCGALHHHTLGSAGTVERVREIIHQWHDGFSHERFDAILFNASGCGAFMQRYPELLKLDGESSLSAKAEQLISKTDDLLVFVNSFGRERIAEFLSRIPSAEKQKACLAFHPPCTLQHGLKIRDVMESLLKYWGYRCSPIPDAHLCCGSAGSYAILQPGMASSLRKAKLDNIERSGATHILSANIGCLHHLQSGSQLPVSHWVVWLAAQIQYARDLES